MYITRTFNYTKAEISEVKIVDGAPVVTIIGTLSIDGEADETTAMKQARKEIPNCPTNIIVSKLSVNNELRGMTVDAFIKNSELMRDARITKADFAKLTPEQLQERRAASEKATARKAKK